MKKLVLGILAHVDAGKTTLSEAILYKTGAIKKPGRVDHASSFLDTDAQERERGITIFSSQATFTLGDYEVTLVDTPGHVDFSAEMERTLGILDLAVIVVSATDGIQAHTETLRMLTAKYKIPTFVFVNKMDLADLRLISPASMVREGYSDKCVDFRQSFDGDAARDQLATCSEEMLSAVIDGSPITDSMILRAVSDCALFPAFFGSALKMTGIDELLAGIAKYAPSPEYGDDFAARVFKITRDAQGNRLTHMKITGGCLRTKDVIGDGDDAEKVEQIRIYSGAKFTAVGEAAAGTVCAVVGPEKTYSGEGLGSEASSFAPVIEPVLTYRMNIGDGVNVYDAFVRLKALEDEDPELHLIWSERTHEIHVSLMGRIQIEVLTRTIAERFGMNVTFDAGSIVYKETVRGSTEGVGHFEPLRHYAEVHLILEEAERGSGLTFTSDCPEEVLAPNWQRLILTHLNEKTHLGVLTGSPITDMKITLAAGRAHPKHTEGGDFRQATYRAVRHGLMNAESVLLEPVYDFKIELPAENLGHAMSDITRLYGTCEPQENDSQTAVLTGSAPVSTFADYAVELAAYTKGRGRLTVKNGGYVECHNAEEVIRSKVYDAEADVRNTPDSVFCANGSGFVVNWRDVPEYMHIESVLRQKPKSDDEAYYVRQSPKDYSEIKATDKELEEIFERTYGPIKKRIIKDVPEIVTEIKENPKKKPVRSAPPLPEYLLIDGYNIIYAWDDLSKIAKSSFELARKMLIDVISNYQGYKKTKMIIVFDAYKVAGGRGSIERYGDLTVIYTKEAETADAYIERATYELSRKYRVRVATSDYQEQLIVLGNGAVRLSAAELRDEISSANAEIKEVIDSVNIMNGKGTVTK